MTVDFTVFYENPSYLRYKRQLFNYLLRKSRIADFLPRPGLPLLDIGSGIAPVAPEGRPAILADSSLAAMKLMRLDGHRAAVLDIRSLGLRSGCIGSIVCSEVLEHVDNDDQALRELHRVLRPHGKLILTV